MLSAERSGWVNIGRPLDHRWRAMRVPAQDTMRVKEDGYTGGRQRFVRRSGGPSPRAPHPHAGTRVRGRGEGSRSLRDGHPWYMGSILMSPIVRAVSSEYRPNGQNQQHTVFDRSPLVKSLIRRALATLTADGG